jgi:tellurite resistance protein
LNSETDGEKWIMGDSFWTFVIICLVIYFIYKYTRSNNVKRTKESYPEQQEIKVNISVSGSSSYKTDRYGPPKGSPAIWYGYDQSVIVCGFKIPHGLIYVGEVLLDSAGYGNDACLINPKLDVVPAISSFISPEMGYWPKYESIPAQCRGAYLSWLAGDRRDPQANIGYVFLFFYGLERRLLLDRMKTALSEQDHAAIVAEIGRLLEIYGENHSFRGYAKNLLALDWTMNYPDQTFPDYIDIYDRFCIEPFKITLAKIVDAGNPVPADIALQWFILHPEFHVKTPVRRCPKEFRALFLRKYFGKFGEGIIVKPNKTKLKFQLFTASPSLRGILLKVKMPELPDPFLLTGPMNKISPLIEECTVSLEPYSRYLGRKENDPNSLSALALLPQELTSQNSSLSRIKTILTEKCLGGFGVIPTKDLYSCLGETIPPQIGKKDAENLSSLLESIGFGIAPDMRFHNIKPVTDGKVLIFPQETVPQPSKSYSLMSVIIRLGAIVSQIDEEVTQSEESTLQDFIQGNADLSPLEKTSLHAFLYWALRTPQSVSGMKQKLSDASPVEKKAISRILISVVLADGRIDPREVKQVEKLYATLGLDKDQVISDIHNLSFATEPVTVGQREAEASFTIPKPATGVESKRFSLNDALIRIREEETQQVKSLLEDIFTEKEDENLEATSVPGAGTIKVTPISALDQAHLNLFNFLISKEKWDRETLHDKCREMGLMIDGAMEVLNEWSFTYANAPLIEDGDPVFIDVQLAREIVDGQ